MKKLAIFGDSFVEGVGDDKNGGWAYRLEKEIPNKYDIYIDGVGGRNIIDIKRQVLSFLEKNNVFCIIINVGINDSRYRASKSGLEIPIDKFVSTYKGTIEYALAKGTRYIILVGLSRVDEDLVLEYKPDKTHTNKNAELIDRAVASLANDKNIIYVPIANTIRANRSPKTLFDGLHPNSIGHELICNTIIINMHNHGLLD